MWVEKEKEENTFQPPEVLNYFHAEKRIQTVAMSHAHLR